MIRKILIIDDETTISEFLKTFFEDRDFNVEIAGNGFEGIEKFQKGKFDLVISDMLMPKMIGLEVLRRIKAIQPDQKIILMTGVKEASMMEKAKALGCHLYLTKPVRLSDLSSRVSECFPEIKN